MKILTIFHTVMMCQPRTINEGSPDLRAPVPGFSVACLSWVSNGSEWHASLTAYAMQTVSMTCDRTG